MRRKKYPLEPLVRIKSDRVETKTRELGQAVVTREALEKSRKTKEADREKAREAADRVRRDERARLEEGALKVKDLAQGGTWETRVQSEDAKREREVGEARAAELGAARAEATAKTHVAEARAEHESVRRHEDRWKAAAKKVEDAREEEALAEIVRPKPAS